MLCFTSHKTLLVVLASVSIVAAHSHVTNIVINGVSYEGYDPTTFPYKKTPPVVVGWSTSQTDNGFVDPGSYDSSDILCHKNARNAGGHAPIRAGERVFIQWETWPSSHHGPVLDYLASCGNSCETVDKTQLRFFKIDAVGLVTPSKQNGVWGTDQLIANNNSWLVQIPSDLAAGYYVLRHEIIALHSAGQENGAQNYPQCFSLQVLDGGNDQPQGTPGTDLYQPDDAGIKVNIYNSLSNYDIPGPTLVSGAVSIAQAESAITASATALGGQATAVPGTPGTSPTGGETSATTTSDASGSTLTSGAGGGNGGGNSDGSPFSNSAAMPGTLDFSAMTVLSCALLWAAGVWITVSLTF